MFGGRLRTQPEVVHRWHFRLPAHARGYAYRLAGIAGWTSVPWLCRPAAPTRILHGDDDPIVPAANARLLTAALPDARLHLVPGGSLPFARLVVASLNITV